MLQIFFYTFSITTPPNFGDKRMKKPKGAFRNWLAPQSSSELAKKLGCTFASVNHWKRGNAYPRPDVATRMIKLSNGIVSYADIYGVPLVKKK